MTRQQYWERRNEVRAAAEGELRKTAASENLTDRELKRLVDEKAEEWAFNLPLFETITVDYAEKQVEIRDEYFNGSITVYGPSRRMDYAKTRLEGRDCYRITPGYVSASSWCAGTHDCTIEYVQREMLHRQRMMELAMHELNRLNELVLDWQYLREPFEDREELKHLREAEKARQEAESKKIAEREARKAKAVR